MVTYAICDLLPSSAASPLALISEAVFIHVNNAFSALLGQRSHGLCSIAKLIQCSGTVAIYDDIHVIQELLKLLSSSLGLQIKICCNLAHVTINLEKWHIGKVWTGYLQNIGTIFG